MGGIRFIKEGITALHALPHDVWLEPKFMCIEGSNLDSPFIIRVIKPPIINGGGRGIRTLDTAFQPYNGLANRRLQPLGHPSIILLLSSKDL